jgi:hypothetical protein
MVPVRVAVDAHPLQRATERSQWIALRGELLIVGQTRAYPILSVVTGPVCRLGPPVTGTIHRTSLTALPGVYSSPRRLVEDERR